MCHYLACRRSSASEPPNTRNRRAVLWLPSCKENYGVEPLDDGRALVISSATDLVRLSIPRSNVANDELSARDWSTACHRTICSISFNESLGICPGRAVPSIQSATLSSSAAEPLSYSRKEIKVCSGSSKPGNWSRYLRDAILIRKRVLNCGCHSRMRSRSARSR